MRKSQFHYSLLTLSVAAFMSLNTANAASNNDISAPAAAINNKATASYSIGTVAQPVVESNIVTVNVTETANFSLIATLAGGSADANINQPATPGTTTTFTHTLSNMGNVRDTYTISTTGNNDPDIDTATPDYALGTADISYVIKQSDGSDLTTAQTTALKDFGQSETKGTITNGGTIKLLPGLIAELSYEAATPSIHNGDDKGVGTLTATSTFFTKADAAKPTLVNENQTIVRLPVFKIEKTATCGTSAPCTTLDLNAETPTIDYRIKVTNATTSYSATATNFVIRDVLPAGMTLSGSVTGSTSVTSSSRTTDDRQIIDVAVASLAVGDDQTISFKVTVDKTKYTTANSAATNNVAVYDKFVGDVGSLPVSPTRSTDYDILDSTDNDSDVTRIPNAADEANGAGKDTATTTTFVNRKIVLKDPTTRQIAPTSGTASQITHQTNIINEGQDIEGTQTNPLKFTITDGGDNEAVTPTGPVTITYTSPDGTVGEPITLTAVDNVYTIDDTTLPSGIAKNGKVAINYNMTSTNAVIGSSETSIVKLIAGGNGAPTVPPVTDTTDVRGLTLLKQLALQVDCTGTLTPYEGELGSNSTASFESKPGDCLYYKITAHNTFDTTSLKHVVVSDATSQWKDSNGRVQAIYQGDAVGLIGSTESSNTGLTGTGDNQKVSTTFETLAGGESGTLTFSTKVTS